MNARLKTGQTLSAARRHMATHLRNAHIETPELDARALMLASLALDLTSLMRDEARVLDDSETHRLNDALARRLKGEPVARITGCREFWGLNFALNADTLVPRPDSETIIEAALHALRTIHPPDAALRFADLGTGSGAMLVALLHEWPQAHGVGTDLSQGALDAAARNAQALHVGPRARFIACDYADALQGPFDLIISNPPYIRTDELERLDIEVRLHDPRLALDGGPDGLHAYRKIAATVPPLLAAGGFLALETGFDQTGAVAALLRQAGLTVLDGELRDLGGRPRGVLARKSV